MKTKLLLVLILFVAFAAQSQVNYKPGYMVLTNGDTLFTKIKYLPGNLMYKKLYYINESGKEKQMPIANVFMYKRDTVEYYNFYGQAFYKLILKGCIELYAYQEELQQTYSSNYNGHYYYNNSSHTKGDGYIYILKKGTTISKSVKSNNMHTIFSFFDDDPEIIANIEHQTGFVNLPSVVESYNEKHPIKQ